MAQSMKAIVLRAHGGLEQLELAELPRPEPGPGEVRVRIRACALNHLDIWVRRGWPALKLAFPHIPGSDIAGEVEALGAGVKGVAIGERVIVAPGRSCGRCVPCWSGRENYCRDYVLIGEHVSGGYCEAIVAPAAEVLPIAPSLMFDQAAAIPVTFLTAWHMLVTRARVHLGETVLVQAAASGVGSAAVQIAKMFGARVIATASTEEKCERLAHLGADEVALSGGDVARDVKQLTAGRGADVVFEHVGKATWEKSLRALALGGRLITCGATTGYDPVTDLRYLFARQLTVMGSTMGTRAELATLIEHVGAGRLRPIVDRTLPLAAAREAQAALEARAQFGKIVLLP